MPVDIPAIAARLRVSEDTVFGRLYFHLDPKYGEESEGERPRKVFFTPKAGELSNCVNFPLLEAVLAGLWQERNRDLWTFWTAAVSLAIAIAALIVSIATA